MKFARQQQRGKKGQEITKMNKSNSLGCCGFRRWLVAYHRSDVASFILFLFLVGISPRETAAFHSTQAYRHHHHLLHRHDAMIQQQKRTKRVSHRISSSSTQLSMSLIPLSVAELELLVANSVPTAAQYSTYWGRTAQERYARTLESAIVSFLGIFFSYFLSFVLGSVVATILGCLFLFWGILSPELKAYQRNWEFLGGRPVVEWEPNELTPRRGRDRHRRNDRHHAGLYAALFLGRIQDVCVVEDATDVGPEYEYDLNEFADYTMDTDDLERITGQPYLLRVVLSDQSGRELQLHARLSEEYLDVQPNMAVTAILLSTTPTFTTLAALTDLFVPQAACWIGDYPYLDRAEMENLLATDNVIWDALQAEIQNDKENSQEVDQAPPVTRMTMYHEDSDFATGDNQGRQRQRSVEKREEPLNSNEEEDYYETGSIDNYNDDDDEGFDDTDEYDQQRRQVPIQRRGRRGRR